MARVAIVVVTYNSAAEIGPCLDAIAELPETEVVVVDNASKDGTLTAAQRAGIRVIANAQNRGFAAAVNQGVCASSAPFVLLLNPDVRLQRGQASIAALLAPFEDPRTGATGGMLAGADGQPQTGFMARNLPTPMTLMFELFGFNRLWPGNPVNWHYRCLGLRGFQQIEQPAGAFLMFSRDAYSKVGGFDEGFFPVWFEDVDFCAKLKSAGYRAFYTPAAAGIHAGGHSVGTLPVEIRQRYWYGSLLGYAAKYYRPITFRAVCFAVLLGAICRAIPGLITGRLAGEAAGERMAGRKKVLEIYVAVTRLAVSRMVGTDGSAAK